MGARRTADLKARAAAGSEITMPARIRAQPLQPTAPRRSPASRYPKKAAKTGSAAKAKAVRVALVRFWAHVWITKASALAKIPVTTSAPQTVHPCGTLSSLRAIAIAVKPRQADSASRLGSSKSCNSSADRKRRNPGAYSFSGRFSPAKAHLARA